MQAPDVDPFVESGVDQALRGRHRIADKSVSAAFPGRRFFAVKIALNILIEIRAAPAKKRIVIRRQADFDFRVLCEQRTGKHIYGQPDRQHPPRHLRFFASICRHVFCIDAISAAVKPEAIKI